MSRDGEIVVEHLWKSFRADRGRSFTVQDRLKRFGRQVTGRKGNHRWALRDINFRLEPGDAVGLVGRNGSGKSTLLRLLTSVMYPTAGRIDIAGRIGALIEVRAGIHPELTGRENVEMYGTLLGLSRRQVAARFDDIVGFAELEDAIDRQVKFYSSGMQMRIGFAVAAYLEPDVLLVDEVLAVGDAAFQQRCLDRMRQVLQQGTTLVYVSHDLASVESTCTRGIWLDEGVIQTDGSVRDVLTAYRSSVEVEAESMPEVEGMVKLLKAAATSPDGVARTQGELHIDLHVRSPRRFGETVVLVGISEGTASPIILLRRDTWLGEGDTEIHCTISHLPLPRGHYYVWVAILSHREDLLPWHPAAPFDVMGPELDMSPRGIVRPAPIHVDASWVLDR